MSLEIPEEVHILLRETVPEIESVVNDFMQNELQQDSIISRQYVYNRALRKIMHNFENSHSQSREGIVEHVSEYTINRLRQMYYDAYEYKHKGMNLDRVQTPSYTILEQPYRIMYERPFLNSSHDNNNLMHRENYWFSTD
ncbi:MAG: hypothetical protein CMB64_04765 [Euryarchaeota archaeon]|nr:hypothetical protein [Euryarchaeota archaeon]